MIHKIIKTKGSSVNDITQIWRLFDAPPPLLLGTSCEQKCEPSELMTLFMNGPQEKMGCGGFKKNL